MVKQDRRVPSHVKLIRACISCFHEIVVNDGFERTRDNEEHRQRLRGRIKWHDCEARLTAEQCTPSLDGSESIVALSDQKSLRCLALHGQIVPSMIRPSSIVSYKNVPNPWDLRKNNCSPIPLFAPLEKLGCNDTSWSESDHFFLENRLNDFSESKVNW